MYNWYWFPKSAYKLPIIACKFLFKNWPSGPESAARKPYVNIRVNSISDALFSGLGVSDNSSSYKTAMITEQLDKLIDAAKAFLEDKGFGAIEIEEVMDDVFGDDCTGTEAVEWKGYWKELELYKEKLAEDPLNAGAAPKVSCNYLFSVLNIPTSSCL